ncbi:LegC family aminotransferase [Cecembia lonarensis]|uniref:UDP-4-amino-4-deoxy-L-arabinose--oxoglutarate aminotransferase n=1 Tax=Cecembia lonarensis (strain CCUG 58316 / KCTC 22772 / LW9) TaxID=1225176 RepID=K1L8W3_CECL9|nr:LegC family aminotransferase [Cecembia lonarensis]EKB48617.1 UDP-4-amino-4-deoxy-L-arabinose--oxoglutarate aminotransferase [Cecembia lonarensis LW9]
MGYKETIQFIQDKFNSKDFIPLHAPVFNGNERKYVMDTLDSTFVSSVGAYVGLSEKMMAEISQTTKAVAVVNGTAGLQIALQMAGVQRGDEVITQALTFVATANAIHYNVAEPVFLDVDYDTMGLSPKAVSEFLEEFGERRESGTFNKKTGKRIAACVPMHTFGFPVHLDELMTVCAEWNIPIIEDAAESLGSYYKGKHTGSFGKLGVFSFNGNKIVTCGGGGMIVTQNEELGKLGKHLTTTAKVPHPYEYVHDQVGYNFRMPNLNAALVCAQLEQLDSFLANKRALAQDYAAFFTGQNIKFRTELEDTQANYWLMCVELENIEERNAFLTATNEAKTMTRPIWQLMYRLPMYQHCYRDSQKNSEFLEERIVNIPSSVRS